jgi:hypothetical protein
MPPAELAPTPKQQQQAEMVNIRIYEKLRAWSRVGGCKMRTWKTPAKTSSVISSSSDVLTCAGKPLQGKQGVTGLATHGLLSARRDCTLH